MLYQNKCWPTSMTKNQNKKMIAKKQVEEIKWNVKIYAVKATEILKKNNKCQME